MKRKSLLLAVLLFSSVVSLSSCKVPPTSTGSSSTSVAKEFANLVSANDIHGRLVTTDGDYGIDILAGNINELEKTYGDFVKIANGDIFQGKFESNVLYGRPVVDCLNEMDFDAFVIGNHEFDWGLDKIAAYNDGIEENGEADFPFLSCNIAYKTNNELLDWVEPYTIVENNGNNVAIIGAIGTKLTSSISGGMLKDYVFLDATTQIEKYAKEIRKEKDVDYVVLAIHDHNESVLKEITNFGEDAKIDAIFTAHTHQKENLVINGVPVVQGGGNNKYVSVIRLLDNYYQKSIESLDDDYVDSKLTSLIDDFVKGEIEEKGNEVVGYNSSYKSREDMAVLLSNTMKDKFDADVGITNTARTSLYAGNILVKDMYEVFPFDNMIIKATISGKMLRSFVNYAYSIYYDDEFSLSNIDDNQTYTMAIIDYVYDNEKYRSFFDSDPEVRVEQNVYMRDLMIDYIKEVKNI